VTDDLVRAKLHASDQDTRVKCRLLLVILATLAGDRVCAYGTVWACGSHTSESVSMSSKQDGGITFCWWRATATTGRSTSQQPPRLARNKGGNSRLPYDTTRPANNFVYNFGV